MLKGCPHPLPVGASRSRPHPHPTPSLVQRARQNHPSPASSGGFSPGPGENRTTTLAVPTAEPPGTSVAGPSAPTSPPLFTFPLPPLGGEPRDPSLQRGLGQCWGARAASAGVSPVAASGVAPGPACKGSLPHGAYSPRNRTGSPGQAGRRDVVSVSGCLWAAGPGRVQLWPQLEVSTAQCP